MCQVVAHKRLKTMKNYNPVGSKVVAVAHERCSFTRGSNYKALAWKNLVFWIDNRLWELVPYDRWSHMEVQLYCRHLFLIQL